MAPLQVLLILLIASVFFSISASSFKETQIHKKHQTFGRRRMLELDEKDQPIKKKIISGAFSSKNKTKILKNTTTSSKNQTKIINHILPSDLVKKNKTKEGKLSIKSKTKKMNSTLKSSDLSKTTSKAESTTKNNTKISLGIIDTKSKIQSSDKKKAMTENAMQTLKLPSWVDQEEDDDDLESGFTDLPSKFQQTLLPDLETISKTSKDYLKKANKEITRNFKPFVGNKYAPIVASLVSFAFVLIPLILVSFIFNKIKAYFSLQKILIFIQVYLSIYFLILSLSSLASGIEPFRFLYATSYSTYVCLQILQTLAYVWYLLLLLMYLILVFSTETGLQTKLLGLAQTIMGFAVGLHYYMMVFHRAVLHEPPKTSWRVHAIYATCFLVVCVFTSVDGRKKYYLEGGEDAKLS